MSGGAGFEKACRPPGLFLVTFRPFRPLNSQTLLKAGVKVAKRTGLEIVHNDRLRSGYARF